MKMDDFGVPLFQETTISTYIYPENNPVLQINILYFMEHLGSIDLWSAVICEQTGQNLIMLNFGDGYTLANYCTVPIFGRTVRHQIYIP